MKTASQERCRSCGNKLATDEERDFHLCADCLEGGYGPIDVREDFGYNFIGSDKG